MPWVVHALIGAAVGLTVTWIVRRQFRHLRNIFVGSLSAVFAGMAWSPLCHSMTQEPALYALAPLWSMGVAMVAVIGGMEWKRWQ